MTNGSVMKSGTMRPARLVTPFFASDSSTTQCAIPLLPAMACGEASHGPVPVPGGEDMEGVLNTTQGPGLTPKGYDIDDGSSYIQLVTFDADGPVAKGMLTYGQVGDPTSPFAYDQLASFSMAAWPAIPFYRRDVERHRQGEALNLKTR